MAAAAPGLRAGGGQSVVRPDAVRVAGAFRLDDVSLADLGALMASGRATSLSLTRQYLARIEEIDRRGPRLNSIIEVNPDAAGIAAALDRERRASGPRGPLHGIPILLKDNLDTHDRMTTTAGSLALAGSVAPRDSFVAGRLRAAGAVLLGKTNLSEWANYRGSGSSSGWSGRGGLTRNPYVLDRNPSGSSSGSAVAVAAGLCAAAVGTETDGSIVSPSSFNGIVGLKPTVGLVSRSGIIPISRSQDTAGPMTRTVTDAAILLGVLAGVDPLDPATAGAEGKSGAGYTSWLRPGAMAGARLGIARSCFGFHPRVDELMRQALESMQGLGAEFRDPVEVPQGPAFEGAEGTVLSYEFKDGINAYLAALGPAAPVRDLAGLIEFNRRHADRELRWFGQDLFLKAQARGPLTDPAYLEALATCRRLARSEGLDATMDRHGLDAIIVPTTGPAHVTDLVLGDHDIGGGTSPAAVAGYPHITVPLGRIDGLPVGISFFGRAWSEGRLLALAFAFEQATLVRRAPAFLPTVWPA